MTIIAVADIILGLLGKIGKGVEEGRRIYDALRNSEPDLPELTDAQIIERMRGRFQSNIADIDATLAALRGQSVTGQPQFRATARGAGAPIPAADYADRRNELFDPTPGVQPSAGGRAFPPPPVVPNGGETGPQAGEQEQEQGQEPTPAQPRIADVSFKDDEPESKPKSKR